MVVRSGSKVQLCRGSINGEGGTCLFERLKIGVFECEELQNSKNHRSEDRRSEDG